MLRRRSVRGTPPGFSLGAERAKAKSSATTGSARVPPIRGDAGLRRRPLDDGLIGQHEPRA
ncbi:MAG: hypothetical protein AB8F26_02965 [Phycisphaerales bacterium]